MFVIQLNSCIAYVSLYCYDFNSTPFSKNPMLSLCNCTFLPNPLLVIFGEKHNFAESLDKMCLAHTTTW